MFRRSVVPTPGEVAQNPRAKSARLRASRKLARLMAAATARRAPRRPRQDPHRARTAAPAPRSGPTVAAARGPRARARVTGVFERIKGLPDHRVIDRLLRGRVWICFVGVALMGIVAMQVSLLKLNSGISRAVETAATLERQNSGMEASIARLASGERIRAGADKRGMVTPGRRRRPLPARAPGRDARRAARRMRAPSDAAKELMANGGVVPGSLMAGSPPRRPGDDDSGHDHPAGPDGDPRACRGHGSDRGHGDAPAGATPAAPAAPAAPTGTRHRPRRRSAKRVRLIERRIGLLFAVFLGMLALAGLRAGWLGVVKADALRKAAATQQTAQVVVPARRGAITDRNGIELAVSQPAMTVAATPYLVKDPVKIAAKLAKPLRTPEDKLLRQLTRRDTGFAYLARRVPAIRARRVERMKIEGLEFIPEARRTYPRDFLASQLLGSVGSEGKGLSGLEYSLDGTLRGRDGERRLVKDALGEAIELRETRKTKPGANVTLTVDEAIQDKAEQVLAEVGETWRPRGATAIVMDPRDGALLALANWPRVDANKPGDAPDYARQNRAVGATYEPGSTFKAFTVAGALEEQEVTPETKFDLPPTIRSTTARSASRTRAARSRSPRARSSSSPPTSARSRSASGSAPSASTSGCGASASASRPAPTCPARRPASCCRSPSTRAPRWATSRSARAWRSRRCRWPSAYAAIANGGVLRPAHIIEKINGRAQPPHQGHRVISDANAASLRKMLEGVLGPGGTASGAEDRRLRAGRQDRHGAEARPGHGRLLRQQVRRLVRRLRARATTRSCSSR